MRTGIFWILPLRVPSSAVAPALHDDGKRHRRKRHGRGVSRIVDGSGQITGVSQDGYVPDNRYLKSYEYGGEDLGPNVPGWGCGKPPTSAACARTPATGTKNGLARRTPANPLDGMGPQGLEPLDQKGL